MHGLLNLEAEWNALARTNRTAVMQHPWFVACADAFCQTDRLSIIVLRDASGIRAIAPLYETRTLGMPRLQMLSNLAYEPSAFLYKDEQALIDLISTLLRAGKAMWLNKLYVGSADAAALSRVASKGAFIFTRPTGGLSSLRLPSSPAELEATMSAGRLRYIKRKRRRAERRGATEFQVVSPDEDGFEPHLREVYRVEGSGWKRARGTAILADPRMERLCTTYARLAARQGVLRLFFMRIGGETAAVRMAVEHAGALWEIKIGYDEQFADCSPGLLLTHETLRYACQKGLAYYEFLGAAESWQEVWDISVSDCSNFRIYPKSVGAMTLMLWDALAFYGRNARQQARRLSELLGRKSTLPAKPASGEASPE